MMTLRRTLLQLLGRIAGSGLSREQPGPPRRILLVKPDHLGDLLLATPALQVLRRQIPSAHITGMIGPWSRRIWQHNPDLDQLIECPFPAFERDTQHRSRLHPYRLLLQYALLLRHADYDTALILRDDHWWGAALVLLAGIPRRIGVAHPLCRPLLSDTVAYHPRDHVGQQALAVVARLTGSTIGDPPELRFTPTTDEQRWADDWLAQHTDPQRALVIIHPGSGGHTKHWPLTHWVQLIDALQERSDVQLLLTGGPAETALVEAISAQAGKPPQRLVGSATLGQLTALLGHAALVLGVDSGPLHLAVSQRVPTIHLFGPSDQQRFGPWGDQARQRVLRTDLACSPCGVFAVCPRATEPPECMEQLTVAGVLQAAGDVLGADTDD
jgi:lipopolysaccharide heptosyltransferase II